MIRRGLNRVLAPLSLAIPARDAYGYEDFLPFKATLAGAKGAHLSLCEFIDAKYNEPGATQATIDHIAQLHVYDGEIRTICEIGPGSGRYLEKTVEACHPAHYEIYETAEPWRDYLVRQHHVIARPTDGRSLAATPTASIDLIQAHKVFVATPFVTTMSYFREMIRVARPGAYLIFDIVTEACVTSTIVERWISSIRGGVYPAVIPRQYALDFFMSQGVSLVGSFFVPMRPGLTETFVFRKGA
jgi:hypothetical protein